MSIVLCVSFASVRGCFCDRFLIPFVRVSLMILVFNDLWMRVVEESFHIYQNISGVSWGFIFKQVWNLFLTCLLCNINYFNNLRFL